MTCRRSPRCRALYTRIVDMLRRGAGSLSRYPLQPRRGRRFAAITAALGTTVAEPAAMVVTIPVGFRRHPQVAGIGIGPTRRQLAVCGARRRRAAASCTPLGARALAPARGSRSRRCRGPGRPSPVGPDRTLEPSRRAHLRRWAGPADSPRILDDLTAGAATSSATFFAVRGRTCRQRTRSACSAWRSSGTRSRTTPGTIGT